MATRRRTPGTPSVSAQSTPERVTPTPSAADEAAWARDFIASIIAAAPRRQPTSEDERRAHAMIADEIAKLGIEPQTRGFRFNNNLYANLALHAGVALLGSVVAPRHPLLGLALHGLAAASYTLDSTRRAFILRRLFRFRPSQNVVATLPATTPRPAARIVLISHADAAFTGTLFEPAFVKRFGAKPGPMYKSLRVATIFMAALAAVDVAQLVLGNSAVITAMRTLFTIAPAITFGLNMEIVLRNQIVPGANDNLSGVAGGILLLRRFLHEKPADVEIVFVATGCEEASLGGSQALMEQMREQWSPAETVVIGIDGFSNGDLRYFTEGEVLPVPLAPWLRDAVMRVAGADPRFAEMQELDVPVGGTDAVPWVLAGYDGVTIGCVDPAIHMPRHYHHPTDTVENLDLPKIPYCVDFVEKLVLEVAQHVRTRKRL